MNATAMAPVAVWWRAPPSSGASRWSRPGRTLRIWSKPASLKFRQSPGSAPSPPSRLNLYESDWFSGPIPAGDYIVRVQLRDNHGVRTLSGSTTLLGWTPPPPRSKDIQPFRITDFNFGDPTMAPPLTGLAEGDGIAIAYYNTPGGSGTADDCLIERREFSRQDGEPPNTEPQELFRFLDRDAQLAHVPWPTGTGLPAQPAGSIDWFW